MKNIFSLLITMCCLFALNSCEDKDLTVYDPTAVTTGDITIPASITLSMDNEDDEISFSWTSSDYNIPVGITYKLQIDASDAFADPFTLYEGNELAFNTTVKDLNTRILNNLGLDPDAASDIHFRVLSSINPNVDDQSSSSKSLNVTPYATEFPPIYMIGAATGGWNTALAVEVTSSAPNVYSTIAYFIGNEAFRFFAQPDWGPTSYNYPHFTGAVSNLFENAGDGDSNFKFVGTTGYYRITANLKTLSVEMESVPEPVMYMTGAATGGWDTPGTGASVKMTFVKENVWEATATFTSGEAFRFFAQADWGPTSYNYPYFADGTVADVFEDAGDGDNNFRFIGTTGDYKVTLNLNDLTVTMVAQ